MGLSSSVLGGVRGSWPDLGTFMLPFGFLLVLAWIPLIRGLGVGGPWILVISFIRVFRLGDCVKKGVFISRRGINFGICLITLAGGNFFGLHGRASATGE